MKLSDLFANRLEGYLVFLLSFVIAFLILLNIFLTYENTKVIESNNRLQDEAEKIKVNTSDLIRLVHQADMGLRGYALIKSELQIDVVDNAFIQIDFIFAQLEPALRRQNFPMTSFYTMRDSTHLYFNLLREMTSLLNQGKTDEFNNILREDRGYQTYKSYLRFSKHVNSFESNISNQAFDRYKYALRNNYRLQIFLFCIAVPALLYVLFLFRKTLHISTKLRLFEKRTVDILAAQNDELEMQVHARTAEIRSRNEEISAQNNEIKSHNDKLVLQQVEIERQRLALEEKNVMLEDAYETIQSQNSIINQKNEELTREVLNQTSELRSTNQELIAHNTRLEQFAYIISHNLRAPIARLIGLSNLLNQVESESERSHIAHLMNKATFDFDAVIKDLSLILNIQKLNTEVYKTISIEEMFNKIIDGLKDDIASTNARIVSDFTSAPALYSLPAYVESIFYNLLSNALKYRDPERQPLIMVHSKLNNNVFVLVVSDNGLGIDLSKYGESMFNLYKRFHFHVEGKGLGLYLVRTQVEALGGQIRIDSKPGAGTKFTIELPAS